MTLNPFHRSSKADTFTEMLFEHRNKDYGAYIIRRDYDSHVSKALLITVSSMALLLLLALILRGSTREIVLSLTPNAPTIYDGTRYKIEKPKVASGQTVVPPTTNKKFTTQIVVTRIDSDNIRMPDSTEIAISLPGNSHKGTETPSLGGGGTGGSSKSPVIDTTDYSRILLMPQVMPEFPSGEDALHAYLSSRLDCTGSWKDYGTSGTIIFSLVVNHLGQVSDVKVEKDNVHFDCAEQAIRVIEDMPRWSPGMQNNIPVNVKYILPIVFKKSE